MEFTPFLNYLLSMNHEIGNHTMKHIPFPTTSTGPFFESINECDKLIQELAGVKPIGFRAPRGNVPLEIAGFLKSLGYAYDSSVCRTFIPGWYEGGFCPTTPYHPSFADIRTPTNDTSDFLEIPLGRFPHLPIPLGGVFIASLPILSARILRRMCDDNRIHLMYVHPVDLVQIPGQARYIWDRVRQVGRVAAVVESVISESAGQDMRLCEVARSARL